MLITIITITILFLLLLAPRAIQPQNCLPVKRDILFGLIESIHYGLKVIQGKLLMDDGVDYEERKRILLDFENNRAWDATAKTTATPAEMRAQTIAFKIREDERASLFGNIASEAIPGPETRDSGGQFLTNKDRINKSKIYKIAQEIPKGCHLHLHFNAELMEPDDFIEQATKNPNMYIRSTQPLVKDSDYDQTEMVFNVLPSNTVEADIFGDYNPDFRSPGAQPWMKWSTFRDVFQSKRKESPEEWIKRKLVLKEEEVYDIRQTTNG